MAISSSLKRLAVPIERLQCRTGSPFAMIAMVTIITLSFIYHVSVQFAVVLDHRPCRIQLPKTGTFYQAWNTHNDRNSSHHQASSVLVRIRLSLLDQALTELKHWLKITHINEEEYSSALRSLHAIRVRNVTHPACQYYSQVGRRKHHAVTKMWKDTVTVNRLDVTLVTQITADKLGTFNSLLHHWQGPVSCSIYLTADDVVEFQQFIRRFPNILDRENLDLHLVVETQKLYPINLLRNVALNNSYTQFVFLSDVDFLPSYDLYQHLLDIIPRRSNLKKEVLVIPAFEFTSPSGIQFPANKSELIYLWNRRVVDSAESRFPSHKTTNYSLWRTTTAPYQVSYTEDYEPYIVANKRIIPPYNVSFLGGFRDKVSHLLHVHAMGLKFTILPHHFAIHVPHTKTKRPPFFLCSHIVYQDLIEKLQQRFPKLNQTVKSHRALPIKIVYRMPPKKPGAMQNRKNLATKM